MYEPEAKVNDGYGPHPATQLEAMLVAMLMTGPTGGANDPVPEKAVPEGAGRRIVSNGVPETIGAVPPVKVNTVGAMAGVEVQTYSTVIAPMVSNPVNTEHLLANPGVSGTR